MKEAHTKGYNPRSLENLSRDGRPTKYGEKKSPHRVTVTQTAWDNLKSTLNILDIASVSELLELLGREHLEIISTADRTLFLLKRTPLNGKELQE